MSVKDELEHLALLAEVDDLIENIGAWLEDCPDWETARRCRRIVRRVLDHAQQLRIRLEAPLVVATFGGTGTGKSSLVNALVGEEVTPAGRQRPTTTTPTLLIHSSVDPQSLGMDLSRFHVRQVDQPVLKDFVLIDCPDVDTSETASAGSNLALLRETLPHCDVLIYTSTQQKYRSARIVDELADAASSCRLVFVQTHADIDSDIRDDWKTRLADRYTVPDMFFVDSVRALREQQEGRRPTGEFGRLLQLLESELSAAKRVQVRRLNLIELLHEAMVSCRAEYDEHLPAVHRLLAELESQKEQLKVTLTQQLSDDLAVSRGLWETRLLGSVTDKWGFGLFASLVRLYNGLGAVVASFTFFRARTSAQMALIGAVQGVRWLRSKVQQLESDESLDRLSAFGISDQQLQECRAVLSGYLRSAKIGSQSEIDRRDLTELRQNAASMEGRFLQDAGRLIDEMIEEIATENSGRLKRVGYELFFLLYPAIILLRIGYNFFWSSFLGPVFQHAEPQPLLSSDFYIPAVIFLVIWCAVVLGLFVMALRRRLEKRIRLFAEEMAASHLDHGLFPAIENVCQHILRDDEELSALQERIDAFREKLADRTSCFLGGRKVG